jgi:O-antigen/teichoic acid export membrane protein
MIARKSLLITVTKIFSQAVAFVGLFFVAHLMGPETLGIIGLAMGILGMFSFILYTGFEGSHVKRISEGKDLGKCIGTYAMIRIVVSIIFVIAVILGIFIWENFLNNEFIYELKIVIYILLVAMVVESLNRIITDTFTAEKLAAKTQTTEIARTFVQPPLKIGIAIGGFGVIFLAGANLVGAVISGLVAIVIFRNYPFSKPDYGYFKSYLKFALPAMFFLFYARISNNLSTVMIGAFFSITEVGYYYTVGQIFIVLQTISAAVAMLLFPTMSKEHSNDNLERISNLAYKAERLISIIFVPIISVIIIFADHIIHFLLGETFLPAVPLLRLMGITVLLVSINRPYLTIIPAINRPEISAIISTIVVTFSLSLNVILIPRELFGITLFGLGALGAALSSVISTSIMTVISRTYLYRSLGFKSYNTRILLHLFAGLVMMAFLHYSSEMVPMNQLPYFIILLTVGFCLYFVILRLLREFKKEDMAFFIDTINPQKMKEYFFEEIKK